MKDGNPKYRIRCSDGQNTWYAYEGQPLDEAKANAEAESCRKMWPKNTFTLERVPFDPSEYDMSKPPPNCPFCEGETEWANRAREGVLIADCHFCGHSFAVGGK